MASGRKLNFSWVETCVGWPNGLASFLASIRKSLKKHFKVDYPLFHWLIILATPFGKGLNQIVSCLGIAGFYLVATVIVNNEPVQNTQ